MNTLKSSRTSKIVLASLLAAFAAQAEAAQPAGTAADTQSRVQAVLTGVAAGTSPSELLVSSAVAPTGDFQESVRRVVVGGNRAPAGDIGVRSSTVSQAAVGSNGQSNSGTQTLTQRVLLGRAAS